jgi:hypothetical protein
LPLKYSVTDSERLQLLPLPVERISAFLRDSDPALIALRKRLEAMDVNLADAESSRAFLASIYLIADLRKVRIEFFFFPLHVL